MYNKIILMGNLTRDIELRYSQSGSAIGSTGLAVNRKWKTNTGEQKEEVMFVDITFFGRTAEIANQYLRKGRQVLVDGRLSLEQWTAQDGSKRSKHAVIVENLQMVGGRDDAAGGNSGGNYGNSNYGGAQSAPSQNSYSQPQQSQPQHSNAHQATNNIPEIDISEDEIPF
jgi:single-strand DNA-binding protein